MAASDERVKAIQRALSHPQFYDGDIGADIRWLLAENELLRDYERVNARDYKALEATVLEFVKRCRDIRDGSPNAFYAHVDRFCKVFANAGVESMQEKEPTDDQVNAAIDALAQKAKRGIYGTSGHAWTARAAIDEQAERLKAALAKTEGEPDA